MVLLLLLRGWNYGSNFSAFFFFLIKKAFGFTSKLVFGNGFRHPHSCEGQKKKSTFLGKG